MNLLIKSTTTILATILAAASGVNAGCANDAGPAMGMMAAEEIVMGSDWFKYNCDPMRRSSHPDPEAECKQFAINYCMGHMTDAVDFKSICRETPPTYLLNSWADDCSYEVSSLIPTPSPSPNPRSYDPVKEGYKAGTKAIDDFYGGNSSKCWGDTLKNEAQKLKYEKFPENQGTPDERAYNQSANIATVREAEKIKDKCLASASANFVRISQQGPTSDDTADDLPTCESMSITPSSCHRYCGDNGYDGSDTMYIGDKTLTEMEDAINWDDVKGDVATVGGSSGSVGGLDGKIVSSGWADFQGGSGASVSYCKCKGLGDDFTLTKVCESVYIRRQQKQPAKKYLRTN